MTSRQLTPAKSITITIVLAVFTIVVFLPFLIMILMSFKNTTEIIMSPLGWPKVFRWDNYSNLFFSPQIQFQRFMWNSMIVTIGALAITLALAAPAGYCFARRRYAFKWRNLLFMLLMLSLMVPMQAMYIPQFQIMARYRLINTRIGLILLYAAYQLAISIFLIRSYFEQLPNELEESARIDGASDFKIFFQIMLPMARPVLLSVTLLGFIFFWNELLLALTLVTRQSMRTVPLAMMYFVGETGADFGIAAASLVVSLIPVLVVYLLFADRFVQGMTAGALKG